ncbi:hypothetical protein RBSWK_04494 [Rhodopirellula baltica SWK14]|uniref:Uncharacterized protein n=1 Tax=Rhodopirellula baltica SWK14 TaxID=993516 RepID=L7CC58_RHOBT|nr:hypothetical protein RBSWK_04494 [Rhodopirellula baltica SWK14]
MSPRWLKTSVLSGYQFTGCVRDLPDVVVQLDHAIGVLAFYGQLLIVTISVGW